MYKCVIVDDEPLDLEGLRRLIDWSALGIEVTAAVSSGFAALDFLRGESADILVTDVKMPIMSGLELARQAADLHPHIKLIVISGFEDFQYAKKAIELRAYAYLLKPVDYTELYTTLHKLRLQLDQDMLYQFETIADMESWFRDRMFEISEKLHVKRSSRNGKLVDEMKKYAAEHIGESFTLKDVAHAFSFSPNYLGFLFKEETGENFSDYVIRRRLEKAKELLKDPRRKIYEVADEIGYKNFTVFNRQFRKLYGITPGDYRKGI